MDCILVVNESVEDYQRTKKRGIILKLDLEKAYDYTDWEFLDCVTARKGFDSKWRSWNYGCLHSSNFSILINGSPKGFFFASHGLRQGDPLSLFLFILVADALNQILLKGSNKTFSEDFGSENSSALSRHADDTLIFLDGERSQLTNLISLIHCFELVFRMRINWQKSCFVSLDTPPHHHLGIAEALKCPIRSFPIPSGSNPAKKEFWSAVIASCQEKLATWKAKFYLSMVVSPSSKQSYRTFLSITFSFLKSRSELLEKLRLYKMNSYGEATLTF